MATAPGPHSKDRFTRRRAGLVQKIEDRGIQNARVLKAVGTVPRHAFVDPAFHNRAYADEALPIGLNQTISQPFTVAYQTALLDPQPGDRVLEVGTGSGYQAAVLCEMGARVFSVERHKPLLDRTEKLLDQLGYRVLTRHSDGTEGWRAFAPYDGIVVTAGATDVPDPLLEQLRAPEDDASVGGQLVIPVGDDEGQQMLRITRAGPESFERESFHSFRFVPLVDEGS